MKPGAAASRLKLGLVAVLLFVVGVGSACAPTDSTPAPAPGDSAAPAAGRAGLSARGLCVDAQSRCLDLAGGATGIVYPALRGSRHITLLWEPGGPGVRPPTPAEARAILPAWADTYDVALVVEPWVMDPPGDACLAALSQSVFTSAELDPAACDWSRLEFDDFQYREIATSLDRLVGPLEGLYATSFGAVRAQAERAALSHPTWLVLDAPAPVAGSSAARLFNARATAVERLVPTVPTCGGGCGTRARALQSFLRAPVSTDPYSQHNRGFAILGLSYDPAGSSAWLGRLWKAAGHPSEDDLETVQDAALSYTRRASAEQVLPDLAGYISGICGSYGEWGSPPADAPADDALVSALRALHRPCERLDLPTWATTPDGKSGPTLLLINREDLVTPRQFQEAWAQQLPGCDVLRYSSLGHGSAPQSLQPDVSRWVERNRTGGS